MEEIDNRILRLIDLLIYLKKIPNASTFADAVSMDRQTVTNVKAKKQHFTATHIFNICKVYNVNANCIFGSEKTVFKNDETTVLTGV